MPEPPPHAKRQPCETPAELREQLARLRRGGPRYAELHCRTNFSFLEGASHADELVLRAAELGYDALAITDRNSLAGVVRAHGAAKDLGFKLIIGAEITPKDAARVVLWAPDRTSYGRLSRLITVGRRRAEKGECELTLDDIAEHSAGLLAGVVPEREGHSPSHPEVRRRVRAKDHKTMVPSRCRADSSADLGVTGVDLRVTGASFISDLHAYRDIFGSRGHLLAELHYGVNDARRLDELIRLSKQSRLPLVAAGDVHYHAPERMPLQHVLTAVKHGTTVAELGEHCLPNAERHLRPRTDLRAIFARAPDALGRTVEIADCCTFSLSELRYEYPEELAPPGETPMAYLRRLTWEEAVKRYAGDVPEKVRDLIIHELQLIENLKFEAFFLTVYDAVRFARERGILCQGRGSAANSAVCYVLGVTAVDPSEHEMLFERFISAERQEAPDIDVDFEHERREEVLQYLYQKYGRERAGIAATVITYRPRSAARDVGKALGLSLDRVDALAKNLDHYGNVESLPRRCEQSGVDPQSRLGRQFVALVNELLTFPRHLSQHVGGMVITQGPLCELVPIENAAMADRTVIEWDKDDLDELGILKVDCLCLGMLTAIRKCFGLIEQSTGRRLTLDTIPPDDKPVYDMITRADTVGVFQIESRAQMSMLPRLKPERFYDLVIEVAIVRPGPIQGNMVHPYLRRRSGEEEVEYPSEEVKHVLERTLGVPLFQEQAMQLAVVAAGFTPGEADQLRRAMAAWRRAGMIDSYRNKLTGGMLAKGYTPEFAERLFNQIRGFGEYGFPESHAASFAKLAYVSSWLKHYYPAAFTAAMINSQPMGFYAPAQLIRDAQTHSVEVRPVDVNESAWDCTLEESTVGGRGSGHSAQPPKRAGSSPTPARDQRGDRSQESRVKYQESQSEAQPALRLGLRLVRGLQEAAAHSIVQARTTTRFHSVADLTGRAGLGRAVVKRLAEADAFGSLRLNRRTALWQALDQTPSVEDLPLLAAAEAVDSSAPALPSLTPQQEVYADYHSAGLTLREHPLSFFRAELDKLGVTPATRLLQCRHGTQVKVAGLVLMRQRPGTAKGITFVTLEDETGIANLIVHAQVWQRYELPARRATALIAAGRLERKDQVIHIIASRLEDMQSRMQQLTHRSRDFR
jgi:error-prone DNA polymerase